MEHVLVATLGDSPIVVTSMYYLLTEQEKQQIDRVVIIYPDGYYRTLGRNIIEDTLKDLCPVDSCPLPFEDTYNEKHCFDFLSQLFAILNTCQQRGDQVYLSLAGGRKNMSAIMALVAPFFHRCIKGLYHVIDKNEFTHQTSFKEIKELENLYTSDTTRCLAAMHPDLNSLSLVSIPLENAPGISESFAQKLFTMTVEQLLEQNESNPDEANDLQFFQNFVNPEPTLQVYLTKQAEVEFENSGDNFARAFLLCFQYMRSPSLLAHKARHKGPLPDPKKRKPYPCYVYKRGDSPERPFFHTESGDIANYPQNQVEWVIVERLARKKTRTEYTPSVEQLMQTKYTDKGRKLEDILKEKWAEKLTTKPSTSSILIVPMGTAPMVATQLYTLLKKREKHDIQKVILLYTEAARVKKSAELAKDAFAYAGVTCIMQSIPGLADIASKADCEKYQNVLEETIIRLQQNPELRIDLALSGGRKGMAAMALFAAQRTQLSEVYHTLITDKELDQRVESEASVEKLTRMKPRDQNDILFLCAYQAQENAFQIFKVPMGPLHGK